jgi:ABC-type dipeptide/oligopeptide/nickel transport system permease component
MLIYSIQRIASGLLTAWVVVTATFFVVRLVPGDPATAMAPPDATPAQIDRIRDYLGLGEPLWQQYLLFLQRLAELDLGTSIRTNQPVLTDIMTRVPASLELAGVALTLEVLVAIPVGIIAAVKRESIIDYFARFVSSFGVGVPVFWVGLMFLWIFSYHLGLFPLGGRMDIYTSIPRVTGFLVVDSFIEGRPDVALRALHHLVLPAITLAIPSIAFWIRLMRGSLLEVLGEDYVRTARAKGLPRRAVVGRHAVRNALNPMVTTFGLELVALLTAAILVELIFAWPGVGNYIFTSLTVRDYPVVQGAVLLVALLYVFVNSAVDIVQAKLDPRVLASLKGDVS